MESTSPNAPRSRVASVKASGIREYEAEINIADAIRECLAVRAELGMPPTVTTRLVRRGRAISAGWREPPARGRSGGLMPALPLFRPWDAVRAFERLGWQVG